MGSGYWSEYIQALGVAGGSPGSVLVLVGYQKVHPAPNGGLYFSGCRRFAYGHLLLFSRALHDAGGDKDCQARNNDLAGVTLKGCAFAVHR